MWVATDVRKRRGGSSRHVRLNKGPRWSRYLAPKYFLYYLALHSHVARASPHTCKADDSEKCVYMKQAYTHAFPIETAVGGDHHTNPKAYWFDEDMATYDYIAWAVQNTPSWYKVGHPSPEKTYHKELHVTFLAQYDPKSTVTPAVLGCKGGYYCPPPPCLFIELMYQQPVLTGKSKTRSIVGTPHCGAVLGRKYNTRLSEPIEYILSTEGGDDKWTEFFPTAKHKRSWGFVDGDEDLDINVIPIARETIGDELILCNVKSTTSDDLIPTILDTKIILERLKRYGIYKVRMIEESPINTVCRSCFYAEDAGEVNGERIAVMMELEIFDSITRDMCELYVNCCEVTLDRLSDGNGEQRGCVFVPQAMDIHSAINCPSSPANLEAEPELGDCTPKSTIQNFYTNNPDQIDKCGSTLFNPTEKKAVRGELVASKHIVSQLISTKKLGKGFYGMSPRDAGNKDLLASEVPPTPTIVMTGGIEKTDHYSDGAVTLSEKDPSFACTSGKGIGGHSEDDCRIAAIDHGLTYIDITSCSTLNCAPLGCYYVYNGDDWHSSDGVYWNSNQNGECSDSQRCLCSQFTTHKPHAYFVGPSPVATIVDALDKGFDLTELTPSKYVPIANAMALIIEGLTMAFEDDSSHATYRYARVGLHTSFGAHFGDCGIFQIASNVDKGDTSDKEYHHWEDQVRHHYIGGEGYDSTAPKPRFYTWWPMEFKYLDCPHITGYANASKRGIVLRDTIAEMSTKDVTRCVLEPVCAPLFASLECFSSTMDSMAGTALIAAGCISAAPDAISKGPIGSPRGGVTRGWLLRYHYYTATYDNPLVDWARFKTYQIGTYVHRNRMVIEASGTAYGHLTYMHKRLLTYNLYGLIPHALTDGGSSALTYSRLMIVGEDGLPYAGKGREQSIGVLNQLENHAMVAVHTPFQYLQNLPSWPNFDDSIHKSSGKDQFFGLGAENQVWGHTTLRWDSGQLQVFGSSNGKYIATNKRGDDDGPEIGTYVYCKNYDKRPVLWYQSIPYTSDVWYRYDLKTGYASTLKEADIKAFKQSQWPTGFDTRTPLSNEDSSYHFVKKELSWIRFMARNYGLGRDPKEVSGYKFAYEDSEHVPNIVFPRTLRHSSGCASLDGLTVTVKQNGRTVKTEQLTHDAFCSDTDTQKKTIRIPTDEYNINADAYEYMTYIQLVPRKFLKSTSSLGIELEISCGKPNEVRTSFSFSNSTDIPGKEYKGTCGIGFPECGNDGVDGNEISLRKYATPLGPRAGTRGLPYADGYEPRFDHKKYFNMLTDTSEYPSIGRGRRQGNKNISDVHPTPKSLTNIQLLKGIGTSPAVLPKCLIGQDPYANVLCDYTDEQPPNSDNIYIWKFHATEAVLSIPRLRSPLFRRHDACLRLSKKPVVDGLLVDAGCERTLYGCGDAYYVSGEVTLILCSSGPLHTSKTIPFNGNSGSLFYHTYSKPCQSGTRRVVVYSASTTVNPGNYERNDDGRNTWSNYESMILPPDTTLWSIWSTSRIKHCYQKCIQTATYTDESGATHPFAVDTFLVLLPRPLIPDKDTAPRNNDMGSCICEQSDAAECDEVWSDSTLGGIDPKKIDGLPHWQKFNVKKQGYQKMGMPDAVQPLEFDLLPVRKIIVPKDDTHVPTYDTETFTCDCAGASPVYTCQTIEEDMNVSIKKCAWSWNRPPNGGSLVGLYIGSKQGPTNIAYRNYFSGHGPVKDFYGRVQPTEATFKSYQDAQLQDADDADEDAHFVQEKAPGLCLRYPYGHTHPLTHNESVWKITNDIHYKVLYTYCGNYTRFEMDETHGDLVYCSRDQLSKEERLKWCAEHPRWLIERTGDVLPDQNPVCMGTSDFKTLCIFFMGHPKYGTITQVADFMPDDGGYIIVAPMNLHVARGFMWKAKCRNILTGKDAECTQDEHDHPVLTWPDWGYLTGGSNSVTPDLIKGILLRMKESVDKFKAQHASACADPLIPIPSNDGQTQVQTDIMCGRPEEIKTLIPWDTVIKKGVTISSCDDLIPLELEPKRPHNKRAFVITTSDQVTIDSELKMNYEDECHTLILAKAGTVHLKTELLDAKADKCTPLIVTSTVKSYGNVSITVNAHATIDQHFSAAISHFGGTLDVNCNRVSTKQTCQILVLNAAKDHIPTVECTPKNDNTCVQVHVDELTNMFGLAEERSLFNNPPTHIGAIWTGIAVCGAVSIVCLIILYFECAKTKQLIESRAETKNNS